LLVVPFRHYEQVIEHMRSIPYGLTNSLYGEEMLQVVKDRLNGLIGIIYENQPFYEGFDVHKRGWGGFKKSGWVQYRDDNGEVKRVHGPKHLISLFSKPAP
jgi:acyl-CoA reductase-like NAD-dependent aldehyde dehydrogenase